MLKIQNHKQNPFSIWNIGIMTFLKPFYTPDELQKEIKNAREEEELKWRKIMLKILEEGHGGGNWRRVIEQNIS